LGTGVISAAQAAPRKGWTGQALLPLVELLLAVAAAGLWYVAGEGLVGQAGGIGPWPLVLLALLWGARWAATRLRLDLSTFSVPLALFLLSAAVGVWAAYDRNLACAGFWSSVSAVGIYWAVSHQPSVRHLYVALAMLGLLAPLLTLYFLASNVWDQYPVKIPLLFDAETAIARFLPKIGSHPIHPNIIGGTVATLFPLYVPLIALTRGDSVQRRWLKGIVRAGWTLCGAISALGLVLSVSRGAWAALAIVAGLWVIWRIYGHRAYRRFGLSDEAWRWRVTTLVVLIALGAGLVVLLAGLILLGNLPGSDALRNRLSLLQDALLLARDYFPIGTGPGTFEMQYSIYTLLIHVGHTTHSHNLFVDLLIEQGLLGLLSYLWLTVAAVGYALHRLRKAPLATTWLLEAGLAVLGVQLLHGLVDDIQYGSRVFMLLPLGLILATSHMAPQRTLSERAGSGRMGVRRWLPVLAALLPLLVLGFYCRGPLAARCYASLGAVEQSRVELGSYDQTRFNERPMELVRREENLDRAIGLLERAVQLDPTQVTARQRLATILLARGEYDQAREHMEAVWGAGCRDSVTRLLLGDTLVATGDVDRAAEVILGLAWAHSRLLGQGWSYYVGERWQQAYDTWQTALLLTPDDEYATYWSAEAKKHLTAN